MEVEPSQPKRRANWSALIATFLALILLVSVAMFVIPNISFIGNFLPGSGESSTFTVGADNTSSQNNNPSILNSSVRITYPSDYATLANFALQIINNNRTQFGLSEVELSPIPSGQQHADSMLYYNYFSHWDTQDLKPYMRYTLLNGTGFVEENVAYEYTTLPSFLTTASREQAISSLEYQMMNNDSICCNNGHKDNILSSFHNRVSIGIAYDSTHIYFVEDFENHYADLKLPISSGNEVRLIGNTTTPLSPNAILVYFDRTPKPLTASSLNTDYYGPYGQGNFTGGVLPQCNVIFQQCYQFDTGLTERANTWQVSNGSINLQFSLNSFTQKYGPGVYTLYLIQGSQQNPEFLTSISVFVS